MASGRTHEQTDALYRARAEVNLLFGAYERRVKQRAEGIALSRMIEDPTNDPNEVGLAAFEQAIAEERILEADATKALTTSGA